MEPYSDLTDGNIGSYRLFVNRKPAYAEYFGFWLNRDRALHRRAEAVALGTGVAGGRIDPGMAYWRNTSRGESEANLKRAQFDIANKQQ